MLAEGIYRLRYRCTDREQSGEGESLAILRAGKLLGSDPRGALIVGRYEYDASSRNHRMDVRFDVPPGGILVTGLSSPTGACLDLSCSFAPGRPAVIDVGGSPVAVKITFLGPIPS